MLCPNVDMSKWRYVGMAMCLNGDKSVSVLSGYVIYGGKQSDNPFLRSALHSIQHSVMHSVLNIVLHSALHMSTIV